MIESNLNKSNFNLLKENTNFQNTSQISSPEVKAEVEMINKSIENINQSAEMLNLLFENIEKEYEQEEIEKRNKKYKPLPFLALMEINMEIQRRKVQGITQPYYKDREFVDHILRVYDVDIWA